MCIAQAYIVAVNYPLVRLTFPKSALRNGLLVPVDPFLASSKSLSTDFRKLKALLWRMSGCSHIDNGKTTSAILREMVTNPALSFAKRQSSNMCQTCPNWQKTSNDIQINFQLPQCITRLAEVSDGLLGLPFFNV